MKAILNRTGAICFSVALLVALLVIPQFAQAQTVVAVPYSATSPTTPHPTYSVCSQTSPHTQFTPPQYTPSGNPPPTGAVAACTTGTLQEISIAVQAEFLNPTSGHSYTYQWSFGDGSALFPLSPGPIPSNNYDLSVHHTYPVATGANAVGANYTATVTVTDTTTSTVVGAASFLVQQQANVLQTRVNTAIDQGLWYMHQTMWRGTSGTTIGSAGSIPIGGWDDTSGTTACYSVNGGGYDDCLGGYVAEDASAVQAFEVSGRLATGPASDPYTDDVQRGLNRIFQFLQPYSISGNSLTNTYTYNPALYNFGCSDGSAPTTINQGTVSNPNYCAGTATQVYYDSGSTSCTHPNCPGSFDGNSNNQLLLADLVEGSYYNYESGQVIDAIVASGTPNATALTGVAAVSGPSGYPGVVGQTYSTIVQDLVDGYEYGQWGSTCDVESGNTRGNGNSCGGGAWLYGAQQGDDNSPSQWAAIGMIAAVHGFNEPNIPQIVLDANNYWVTFSQDVQAPRPSGTDPVSSGDNYGAFGYRGSDTQSAPWGNLADTPSGMVQMSMDSIGRTTNVAFGDLSTAPDQRFNNAETMYADNFCNANSSGATIAPRDYTYGLFSFTKSMLLHSPGGVLTPIQYLRTQTPGVFPNTNPAPGQPANTIDWYSALDSNNGGTDACNGVAQTLINRQGNAAGNLGDYNVSNPGNGFWWGNSYSSDHWYFETPWSIIMLRQSVFVSCISNLYGRGTPGVTPRIDLSWSAQANAASYAIYRATSPTGTPTQIGTTNGLAYSDRSGLTNGDTYYYTVQPLNGNLSSICSSNQEKVIIP